MSKTSADISDLREFADSTDLPVPELCLAGIRDPFTKFWKIVLCEIAIDVLVREGAYIPLHT